MFLSGTVTVFLFTKLKFLRINGKIFYVFTIYYGPQGNHTSRFTHTNLNSTSIKLWTLELLLEGMKTGVFERA